MSWCSTLRTAYFVGHGYHVVRMPPVARHTTFSRTTSTWQGAGCRRRALGLRRSGRALGLRRGVAGDVVLLLVFGSVFSVVGDVFCVPSFLLFPFLEVHRSKKPYIFVLQIITVSGLRFFFHKSFKSSSHLLTGLPALLWSLSI